MKLIDLLVRELPKHGGWPEGAVECQRFVDEANIDFYDKNGNWDDDCLLTYGAIAAELVRKPVVSCEHEQVTFDQYQSALAASQKAEWDGDGLPPVGVEFEYGTHRTKAKCIGIGHHMIFASKGNPDDEESDYEEFMISILDSEFYHARTDAQRKTDEALKMLELSIKFNRPKTDSDLAECIYDAIAAGKIPGVRLED